jgi:hypothetical protein
MPGDQVAVPTLQPFQSALEQALFAFQFPAEACIKLPNGKPGIAGGPVMCKGFAHFPGAKSAKRELQAGTMFGMCIHALNDNGARRRRVSELL